MTSPRLSAIMPTADRRRFVPQAIGRFQAQNRDDAELVILDDGADSIADLIPADPRIRYVRDTERRPLGAKRNRLCELAHGDIIVHWDDDDWHACDRLARQLAALEATGADICGLDRVHFLAEDGSAAWDYVWPGGSQWLYGATLAYRRSFWERHRFPAIRVGEDTRFVLGAGDARIHAMSDGDFIVACVHAGNTSPKRTTGGYWHPRDPGPLIALIGNSPPVPQTAAASLVNVNAVLVHESPDCAIDLVRNLRHLDPSSTILIYDGSRSGGLLDRRLPWTRWGAEIVANPKAMKWGSLHGFALDCIAHLRNRNYDLMTVVDSDQLLLRSGYPAFLASRLGDRRRLGVLSNNPLHQGHQTRIPPAVTAQRERELWRPFLRRFRDGEDKFVHWMFWPASAISAEAGRAIAELFHDPQLQHILAQSKLWATEEVLIPTLAALLGFDVVQNPCRQTWVQYKKSYGAGDFRRALADPHAYWMHPVPRRIDDPMRVQVRIHYAHYSRPAAVVAPPQSGARPTLIETMRGIDGWLDDGEATLLLDATERALARPGAASRVAEIGCYCGKATYLLASVARACGQGARVIAIDRFDGVTGARDARIHRSPPTRSRFDRTLARHDLASYVEVHTGDAADFDWKEPLDLLLIDGLHDYAAVASDFAAFEGTLGCGARIAFHDYADYFPSVMAFVDELVATGQWDLEAKAGTLRVLVRR